MVINGHWIWPVVRASMYPRITKRIIGEPSTTDITPISLCHSGLPEATTAAVDQHCIPVVG